MSKIQIEVDNKQMEIESESNLSGVRILAKKLAETNGCICKNDLKMADSLMHWIFIRYEGVTYWCTGVNISEPINGCLEIIEPDSEGVYDFKHCKRIDLTRFTC